MSFSVKFQSSDSGTTATYPLEENTNLTVL